MPLAGNDHERVLKQQFVAKAWQVRKLIVEREPRLTVFSIATGRFWRGRPISERHIAGPDCPHRQFGRDAGIKTSGNIEKELPVRRPAVEWAASIAQRPAEDDQRIADVLCNAPSPAVSAGCHAPSVE